MSRFSLIKGTFSSIVGRVGRMWTKLLLDFFEQIFPNKYFQFLKSVVVIKLSEYFILSKQDRWISGYLVTQPISYILSGINLGKVQFGEDSWEGFISRQENSERLFGKSAWRSVKHDQKRCLRIRCLYLDLRKCCSIQFFPFCWNESRVNSFCSVSIFFCFFYRMVESDVAACTHLQSAVLLTCHLLIIIHQL